jgi:5'-nucleotidase
VQSAHPKRFAVAISSEVLFDFEAEDKIQRSLSAEDERRHQVAHDADALPPGQALPLVKALLRLSERASRQFELVVVSPASADASPRLFASIHEHALQVTRAAFTGGEAFGPYLHAFGIDLFLSAKQSDVSSALAAGTLAALVTAPSGDGKRPIDQVRVAFDGNAAVFAHSRWDGGEAGGNWPKSIEQSLANLMKLLSELQTGDPRCVRTALLTRRTSPAQEPVLKALREANVRLDEAFFGSDLPREQLLEVFSPHFLFGDGGSHFRVPEEIATADLYEIEEEEKAPQTAFARLQQRASQRGTSAAPHSSPDAAAKAATDRPGEKPVPR